MKADTRHVVAGILLLIGGGIAYLATRSAGNLPHPKYTEVVLGPLQKQLVSVDELNLSRTFTKPHYPVHYPGQVAAGISQVVARGFAPLWKPADPTIAALPAEQSP